MNDSNQHKEEHNEPSVCYSHANPQKEIKKALKRLPHLHIMGLTHQWF